MQAKGVYHFSVFGQFIQIHCSRLFEKSGASGLLSAICSEKRIPHAISLYWGFPEKAASV
jgi:hypothetical protein